MFGGKKYTHEGGLVDSLLRLSRQTHRIQAAVTHRLRIGHLGVAPKGANWFPLVVDGNVESGRKRTWVFDLQQTGMQPTQMQGDVVAAMMVDGVLRFWVAGDDELTEYRLHQLSGPTVFARNAWGSIDVNLLRDGGARCCVVKGEGRHSAIAVIDADQLHFCTQSNGEFETADLPSDLHAHDIAVVKRQLQLVATDNSRLKLICHNPLTGERVTHFTAEFPIDDLCCASIAPLAACRAEGHGYVVDLAASKVLLKVNPALE